MIYIKEIIDHKIGDNTQFRAAARSLGWTITKEDSEVERSDIDGALYELGYAPMKTDEQKAQEEAERIAMLSLTRGDVFRALYKAKGVTREILRAGISSAEITETFTEQNKELALIDFDEALNFYRGNELLDVIGLQLGISSAQMDNFFETGAWEELVASDDSLE